MKTIIKTAISLSLLGLAGNVSAFSIGHLNQGSQSQAGNNLAHYVSEHAGSSVTGLNNTTFDGLTTAQLASTYDVLVMPWNISSSANFSWNTVINPYLQAGGSVLWEDPNNLGDLTGSGITFGGTGGYTRVGRTLVAPFDQNGAESHYHIHFGITAHTSEWDVWGTDDNGSIHGLYGEIGGDEGRMIISVSDNLYHPDMSNPAESDHYNLLINQLNWLSTGDVNITAGTVPEPATLALLGLGLAGISMARKKKAA